MTTQSLSSADFAAHMRTNPFLKELLETFLHVSGRHGEAGGRGEVRVDARVVAATPRRRLRA